jgi:stringent starvation protein B
MLHAPDASSTRPYLLRALHEWCTDNGYTPYVAVLVDDTVQVPQEYVKNGEIVLNVSYDATSGMKLGNEFIEFKARFAGTAREIIVPVNRVLAIYARENGQGMAFPMPVANAQASAESTSKTQAPTPRKTLSSVEPSSSERKPTDDEPPTPPPAGGRPSLTRVK